jgi:D-alanyl-D-alanine carboxypeptidase
MKLTSVQLKNKYGDPTVNQAGFERLNMMVWDIPQDINTAIPHLPNKVYINRAIQAPLEAALRAVIAEGVRKQRGIAALSMHSFGIAIDMNAAWNPLVRGVTPETREALRKEKVTWSEKFLDCWRNVGWTCGADWNTVLDGMHFEWTNG